MGKISIFNKEQKIILDELKKNDFLRQNFYFTGGTALSSVYLQHRYSEDLDFFTTEKFDNQTIFALMSQWSKKHQFIFQSRFVEPVYIFNLRFENNLKLKIDFAYYPYSRIEKGVDIQGVQVDSLFDIAVNKLLSISQRTDVKDFVDIYFLLDKFTVWDLIEGVRKKFKVKVEPILLASDFLKAEDFDFLPKMIVPLKLSNLREKFRKKAKKMGIKAVDHS